METKPSSERMAEALQRSCRHWLAELRMGATSAAPTQPAFTIALSREAGAQGAEVARAVGERLGWAVYDRELLQHIGDQTGLREELLSTVDEKRQSWLLECVQAVAKVPTVSVNAYVHHLVRSLISLAAHGECVIVGRGAAQILPRETTLRVRLIAPLDHRVEVVRCRLGVGVEEATRWIDHTDKERRYFVQDHFHKDVTDQRLYDLVMNSSRFSVAECAELIIEALHRLQRHCAGTGQRTPPGTTAGMASVT